MSSRGWQRINGDLWRLDVTKTVRLDTARADGAWRPALTIDGAVGCLDFVGAAGPSGASDADARADAVTYGFLCLRWLGASANQAADLVLFSRCVQEPLFGEGVGDA